MNNIAKHLRKSGAVTQIPTRCLTNMYTRVKLFGIWLHRYLAESSSYAVAAMFPNTALSLYLTLHRFIWMLLTVPSSA